MARKEQKEEPENTPLASPGGGETAGAAGPGDRPEGEALPPPPILTEEQARAAAPGPSQPMRVISALDRSLIVTQGTPLTRQQLNDLRRKLKSRFH